MVLKEIDELDADTAAALSSVDLKGAGEDIGKIVGVTFKQKAQAIDMLMKQQAQRGAPDTPEMRTRVREELISMEAVSQEATRRGLEKNPDVLVQLELARQNILAQAYIADYIAKNPTSEATMKAEYEKIRSTLGEREYRVRHILVKTEAEAKEIMAAIAAKKTTFEKAAAERSEDAGSKGRGGELDWTPPANLVKPFADAMPSIAKPTSSAQWTVPANTSGAMPSLAF
jgi:peptidyl-prolyl cis-trans isomerase C